MIVVLNKLGELSDAEGSIKSFAFNFEFYFTLSVTKCITWRRIQEHSA